MQSLPAIKYKFAADFNGFVLNILMNGIKIDLVFDCLLKDNEIRATIELHELFIRI